MLISTDYSMLSKNLLFAVVFNTLQQQKKKGNDINM